MPVAAAETSSASSALSTNLPCQRATRALPFLDSSTYDNTTLAGLGVTPGTYVYRLTETGPGTRSRSRSEPPRCRNPQALP